MQKNNLRNIIKFMYYRLPYLIVVGSFLLVLLLTSTWMMTSSRSPKPSREVADVSLVVVEPTSSPVSVPELPLEIVGLHDLSVDDVNETAAHQDDEELASPEILRDLNLGVKNDVKSNLLKSSPIVKSRENSEKVVETVKSKQIIVEESPMIQNPESESSTVTMEQPRLESRDQILSGSTTDKTYTVQPGDCLWDIAAEQLGDPFAWVELYELNNGTIGDNPNIIYPGQVLILP